MRKIKARQRYLNATPALRNMRDAMGEHAKKELEEGTLILCLSEYEFDKLIKSIHVYNEDRL